MKLILFFFLFVFDTHAGFKLFIKDFKTKYLPVSRDIYVYLPPGYGKTKSSYPVLYMHDGQNLFDPKRAFMGQTWQAEKTLDELIKTNKIAPIIVVAIDNTTDRLNEYTPHFNLDYGRGGKGRLYLQLITQDLMPIIEDQFLVKTGAKSTGIMGSSLGGLISLYAGAKEQDIFGLIGALSPSVWWNDFSVLETLQRQNPPFKVYLSSGLLDGERPMDTKLVAQLYLQQGLRLNKELFLDIDEEGNHNEQSWARLFPHALKALFGQGKNR